MFVIPGLVCPTSLAGGQSWEKLWFSTTLFEELCKHIVLSNWAEEESSGWEGRTWEGRGWNLWWEHTQWGQEGHSFCFTHTAFIQACQSHPHLCHFQKTSQNSHLLTVPWDCKIKSCPNPLSPEAILSELWAAIHGFGIPQYTQFYHRVVELEHFLFWSLLCLLLTVLSCFFCLCWEGTSVFVFFSGDLSWKTSLKCWRVLTQGQWPHHFASVLTLFM